jgi:hypothetical protein
LALEAREKLQAEGTPTRVVSMPCLELFEEQPADYHDQILPPAIAARLAIEAGVRQGWDRYVGAKGDVICLDRFGGSAPGDVALRELGFNVENVLSRARGLLYNLCRLFSRKGAKTQRDEWQFVFATLHLCGNLPSKYKLQRLRNYLEAYRRNAANISVCL